MIPGHRLRSVGWIALIGLCFALFTVLSFRVNALKSEVRLAENRIVALKREKIYLETEFETRASQQQLKAWNDIEFGYAAPASGQYLEGERQLAALGKPAGPDAPRPIRVASADDSVIAAAAFPAMVSPLTGEPLGDKKSDADSAKAKLVDHAAATAGLGERLGKVERPRAAVSSSSDDEDEPVAKPKKAKLAEKPADKPRTAAASAKATKDAGR
jgi:hypothetical protein